MEYTITCKKCGKIELIEAPSPEKIKKNRIDAEIPNTKERWLGYVYENINYTLGIEKLYTIFFSYRTSTFYYL